MASEQSSNAAQEAGFFDGRLLIRINTWDWPLSLGLSSDFTPSEYRFRGGLHYVRAFEIAGEIVAPKAHVGRPVRGWISPFDESLRFGPQDYPEVGRLFLRHPEKGQEGLSMTILVPEDAIATVATSLASTWRYLHIWTFNEDAEQASIRSYSFSAHIHPNLKGWVNGD
jgi:hypothetical protein